MKTSQIVRKLLALKQLFPVDFFRAFYNSTRDEWDYDTGA